MLSTAEPPRAPAAGPPLPVAYSCSHTAFAHDGEQRGYWLGRCAAPTPTLALEWLRRREWATAVQIGGSAVPVAEAWLADPQAGRELLHRLATGQRVSFSLADDQARYEVCAKPLNVAVAGAIPGSRPARRRHAAGVRQPTPLTGWRCMANCLAIPAMVIAGTLAALLMCSPRIDRPSARQLSPPWRAERSSAFDGWSAPRSVKAPAQGGVARFSEVGSRRPPSASVSSLRTAAVASARDSAGA